MELCREAALNLKKCMDEHADHYAPLLRCLPPGAGEGKDCDEGKKDDGEEEADSFSFR
ncbi:hypothetical protein SEVIR_2G041751v4 [Setaria viridis]